MKTNFKCTKINQKLKNDRTRKSAVLEFLIFILVQLCLPTLQLSFSLIRSNYDQYFFRANRGVCSEVRPRKEKKRSVARHPIPCCHRDLCSKREIDTLTRLCALERHFTPEISNLKCTTSRPQATRLIAHCAWLSHTSQEEDAGGKRYKQG